MLNEIQIAQQELIEDFSIFEDWMDRYQYLIDLGRRLPEFADELRTDDNRIRGCQSQVWFVAHEKDGRLHFEAISDAAIVSGLIALLLRVYSGRTPQDILGTVSDVGATNNPHLHFAITKVSSTAESPTAADAVNPATSIAICMSCGRIV